MSGSTDARVAVVTGGGGGIGRAVAHGLVDAGFRVVVCGRRWTQLRESVARSGHPDRCCPVVADVRSRASVDSLFEQVLGWGGRLDLLVNNAGINGRQLPIHLLDKSDWSMVLDTNVSGAFHCAQVAFRQMINQRPQGGRIINNGSLSAMVPRPNSGAYGVSKHALTGLTKSLALEGRRYRIACGQIDVGNAATAMTEGLAHGTAQADGTAATEPTISVKHVADAVVYMARLPLDANVHQLTLMATGMPFLGRG